MPRVPKPEYVIYGIHFGDQRYRYIGQTGSFQQRIAKHKYSRSEAKTAVAKWLSENDWSLVRFEILDRADTVEELRDLEVVWIAKLRGEGFDLLNLTDGGEGLFNPAAEVREKMSAGRTGELNHRYGKPKTEKQRDSFLAYNLIRKQKHLSKGSKNNKAILKEESVLQLRIDYATGAYSQREIAEKYGISFSNVYNVVSGKTWKHVGGPTI